MKPGTLVAERFEIEAHASAGSTSVVYRARDRQTGDAVALKLVRFAAANDTERFGREARVLADLRHPAIVQYVSHGTDEQGDGFLVMEWLEGEDLARRIGRDGLSPAQTVALLARVADALAVAHARGVVHRDIKPANIFLVAGDIARAKLLDFGVARPTDEQSITATGVAIGTPSYMAPEQTRGERNVDARADVFALGCVLYRCITGRAPFAGESIPEVFARIVLHEPPSLRALVPELPEALATLCARMLSKDPAARPADAGVVAEALRAIGPLDGHTRAPEAPSHVLLTNTERRMVSVVLAGPVPDAELSTTGVRTAAPGSLAPPDDFDATTELGPAAEREVVAAIAETHGGHVTRLAGGVLAVTLAAAGVATDQCAHAARCALALRDVVAGPVVLATGRSATSGRGTVSTRSGVGTVDEAVDRASELLRLATLAADAPDATDADVLRQAVLLDDVTAGLLDARFDVRRGALGLALWRERDATTGCRPLLGRESPCVGRERELAALRATFAECVAEGVARAVLVTAAAGVGKSRLAGEFLRAVRAEYPDAAVWTARGDPMRQGSPFATLAQLIHDAAGVLEGEPLAVRQSKLRARLARCLEGDALAHAEEFLAELVGAPLADGDRPRLCAARQDARVMTDQLLRAWLAWFPRECVAQPVVLVLEDLHWGDLPSTRFIDAALAAPGEHALCVLALARPEVHDAFPKLWAERALEQVHLGELTRRASERLVRAVLGPAVPAATVERVIAQAGGNAFYLEELIRAVAEDRADALPDTVLAMAQARIERLDPSARRALRAASVFGETFWRGAVAALTGGDGAERGSSRADDWLDVLVEREVLVRRGRRRFADEDEFAFRHALLRDAAYAMLTDDDRALGHRLAGAWLERAGERDAVVLAEHFERGREHARAVRWYLAAAESALSGSDLDAALLRARRGIACGATGVTLGALHRVQTEAHYWRSEHVECEAAGVAALAALSPGSEEWYRAAALTLIAAADQSSFATVFQVFGALRERLAEPEVNAAQVLCLVVIERWLVYSGQYEHARPFVRRIAEIAALPGLDPATRAWTDVGRFNRAVFADHDAWTARAAAAAAAETFRQLGDARSLANATMWHGWGELLLGEYARAEALLRTACGMAERLGLAHILSQMRNFLGVAVSHQGRFEDARAVHATALAMFDPRTHRVRDAASRLRLAVSLVLAGDYETAAREGQAAAEKLAHAPPLAIYAQAVVARALAALGRGAEALALARDAHTVLHAAHSACESPATVDLAYAEALAAAGDAAGARAAIGAARAALLERAARVPDADARRVYLAGVPEHARTLALAAQWGA